MEIETEITYEGEWQAKKSKKIRNKNKNGRGIKKKETNLSQTEIEHRILGPNSSTINRNQDQNSTKNIQDNPSSMPTKSQSENIATN